ncbi:MAG: GxxExxY protein [Bacteroidota bacterium]
MLHSNLTNIILKSYYQVYNYLGYGFLEKVYENALFIELCNHGLNCTKQTPIKVYYLTHSIGTYFADILVEDKVIIELKAAEHLCFEHECQLINYLKATEIEVGLLLNFGKDPQFKRKIFSNKLKNP